MISKMWISKVLKPEPKVQILEILEPSQAKSFNLTKAGNKLSHHGLKAQARAELKLKQLNPLCWRLYF